MEFCFCGSNALENLCVELNATGEERQEGERREGGRERGGREGGNGGGEGGGGEGGREEVE